MAIKIASEKGVDEKREELIFELMKRRFDGEIDIANRLDTKAGNMVGFASVVIALTLGGGSVFTGEVKSLFLLLNSHAAFLNFVGMSILLISVGCALVALRVKAFLLTPDVDLLKEFLKTSKTNYLTVLHGITNAMGTSISNSQRINDRKAMFIEASWYSLLAGLVVIFASYCILALESGHP